MADYVELDVHRAIVCLPENAIEITVIAKVYDSESKKILDVTNTYGIAEIREMFRKADEGYVDDDDVFTITDKGREYLKELERKGSFPCDE